MPGQRAHRTAPRALTACAVLTACAALSACGKSNPSVATVTVTRAASAPAPAHENGGASRTHDSAFAAAVNLRPGDVPGFTATREPNSRQGNEPQLEERLGRCAGALGTRHTGEEASSPEFTRPGDQLGQRVNSSVSFLRSASSAAGELTILRSPRTRGCLVEYLQQLVRGRRFGSTAPRISITPGSPPAPGSAGGFGWRVTAVFRVKRLRVPYYLDVLGFIYRRAEVTLLSSGALIPFPAGQEERLFKLLLARASAQKL